MRSEAAAESGFAAASSGYAAEKCSPIVFVPGHKRGPNDCRTENFVTRAICQ
jgi:hypothetical protein